MFFCFGWLGQHRGQQLKHTQMHTHTHTHMISNVRNKEKDRHICPCVHLWALCAPHLHALGLSMQSRDVEAKRVHPGWVRGGGWHGHRWVGEVSVGIAALSASRWTSTGQTACAAHTANTAPCWQTQVIMKENKKKSMSRFVHKFALTTLKRTMRDSKCTFCSSACVWVADK